MSDSNKENINGIHTIDEMVMSNFSSSGQFGTSLFPVTTHGNLPLFPALKPYEAPEIQPVKISRDRVAIDATRKAKRRAELAKDRECRKIRKLSLQLKGVEEAKQASSMPSYNLSDTIEKMNNRIINLNRLAEREERRRQKEIEDVATILVSVDQINLNVATLLNAHARLAGLPIAPVPLLNGQLPGSKLPQIASTDEVNGLNIEQCDAYLNSYGLLNSTDTLVEKRKKLIQLFGLTSPS